MRAPILERLATGGVLIADGATGTMLQAAGLPAGMPGEAWVLERPAEIMALHRAYVEAGSQIILTATFGGTRARLKAAGLDPQVAEINRRAGELARRVAGDEVYVGGDIGPSGEMMPPLGKLTFGAAVEMFAEQAEALASGGVDCIYIETMSDLNEAKAAVEGAQKAATVRSRGLPVFCTSALIPTATPAWVSALCRQPRRWIRWACKPPAPTVATPRRRYWPFCRRCARRRLMPS